MILYDKIGFRYDLFVESRVTIGNNTTSANSAFSEVNKFIKVLIY